MTPILQLVLLGAQPQHGLRVPVQLVVQVVQQGSPSPVLQAHRGLSPAGRSSASGPATSSCLLEGSATHGHRALVPASTDPGQQGKVALRRNGRTPKACSSSVTSSLANLSDLQQAYSALMSLVSRNSRNSGLCRGRTKVENTHCSKSLYLWHHNPKPKLTAPSRCESIGGKPQMGFRCSAQHQSHCAALLK